MAFRTSNEDGLESTIEIVLLELKSFFESDATAPLNFDRLSDSVYVKNAERIITFSNLAHRKTFSAGRSTIGMRADSFLQESIESISSQTDGLILSGVSKMEFEHVGFGSDNRKYLFRSYKHSLIDMRHEPFAILGISRCIEELHDENDAVSHDVLQLFKIYSGLPDQDKTICLSLASGKTTSEIAETMGMTTRAIEIRRKKLLNRMGLTRPVEIVILMTRFDERKLASFSTVD